MYSDVEQHLKRCAKSTMAYVTEALRTFISMAAASLAYSSIQHHFPAHLAFPQRENQTAILTVFDARCKSVRR